MALPASRSDLFAAGIFIALGGYFAVESLSYDIGTALRMGPGFMPLALGGILAALGVAIAINGFRHPEEEARDPPSWRAIVLIIAAIALFGFGIRGLGFVPTVFASVFLTALASRNTRLPGAVVIAAGLTLLSTLVFVFALRLQVPLVGPWLQF